MNKNEILYILRKYNFDSSKYIVISSASMVIQGLKESTKDIDIAVSKDYYEYLINNYEVEFERENLGVNVYYIDNVINFSTNYYNPDEVIMYEGIPVQSLEGIRNLKSVLGREKDIKDINIIDKYLYLNPLALAYLGDSVYEVHIRKYLIDRGNIKVNELQKKATNYVSAKSQKRVLDVLLEKNFLTSSELDVVRRGRNTKSHKAPKNTDIITYKAATGFETLIGYLYLQNNTKRINEIIEEIIGD